MKFKEQSFILFAYTNYRTIHGSHRIEPLDFKEKGTFHHFSCTIEVEYVFRGTTDSCGDSSLDVKKR